MLNLKARVTEDISFLMRDEEFKRRVVKAYFQQVGPYNENGFLVEYKGWRIRFEPHHREGNDIIWLGAAEDEPTGRQTSIVDYAANENNEHELLLDFVRGARK